MHSLDSPHYVHALEKCAPTVAFHRSTPQSLLPDPFSDFDSLRVSHNPLRLHGRHQREGRFHLCRDEFHPGRAQFSTFERTKRQPRYRNLRQRIRGQYKQSEFDDHQFRHKLSDHFPSQCFWRRVLDRRGGATREPKSGQQRNFHCELRTHFAR